MTATWATDALEALQQGKTVQVRPRGHSMIRRVNHNDLVTLEPLKAQELTPGDIVLVRIHGKRYSHIVLHLVLSVSGSQFLIGSHQGRVDGWVGRSDIYGVATSVEGHE